MEFLSRLFRGKHYASKTIARERLRLVLAHDRSGVPPGLLNLMKKDMIEAISKHVHVDRNEAEVSLSHSKGHTRLVADIPIRSTRPGEAPNLDEQGEP